MRNISFFETQTQFRNKSKTVTRRLAWWTLKPNTVLMGVEKAQGLGKGGKIVKIHPIKILSVKKEKLSEITKEDVVAEGFPEWTPEDFIKFFMEFNKCGAGELVNRIEFEHLEAGIY